jgi:hypothetical protein
LVAVTHREKAPIMSILYQVPRPIRPAIRYPCSTIGRPSARLGCPQRRLHLPWDWGILVQPRVLQWQALPLLQLGASETQFRHIRPNIDFRNPFFGPLRPPRGRFATQIHQLHDLVHGLSCLGLQGRLAKDGCSAF